VGNQWRNPALGLAQKCFATDHRTKLFGSIVTREFSREGQQSSSVASRQNYSPPTALRIQPSQSIFKPLHSPVL
jgi:hypothetical protein